jgi:hypothetical protein
MSSSIQNVGQQPTGQLPHHADVEPDETAHLPARIDTTVHVPHANESSGHSQHAGPQGSGDVPNGSRPNGSTPNGSTPNGSGQPSAPNLPGGQQTTSPNGNGPNGPGLGHSQHGLDNTPGPQGNQGNGLGNGLSNPGNGAGGLNGVPNGNGFGANGSPGIGWGEGGSHGLGGLVGDTLGGLLGPPNGLGNGGLAAFGNFAGIVQNTVAFAQNPVGSANYALNENVALRTRPGEPIVDSDPGSSRAPVRSDSPGTTTSATERPPSGSETNVFVRAASSDPSPIVPNSPRPTTSPNAATTNAPAGEVAVRETVAPVRTPANETIVARADNAVSRSGVASDPAGTNASPSLLAGTAAPAQAGGELAVLARVATPLTLISAAPLAGDGESVSEVGRMALFRADAGDGRESVQDIYGRNYVVYAGDGRNVDKPGSDRAIKAIGTPNIDSIAQDRAANHGELSTHELIWKTVVPALVGVGALFGGASAAGLAVAGSGGAAPFLLAASTVIFGYGALRASLSLRDRAQAGIDTNPLQSAEARRHWIAAGANSAGLLASLALMIA